MGKDLRGKELGRGISQRHDKYYVARFTAQNGERITKTFKKVAEAQIWLRDATYDDAHSNVIVSNDVTVDTWFNYWMDNIMYRRIKYNTKASYTGRYENRIKPVIGNILLSELKPLHCQNVLNYCMKKNDVSDSMAKVRSIMKNMFDSAIENRMLASNPVVSSVKYQKTTETERRVLSVEEQKAFKELAKLSSYGDVFIFILNTGLRIGEISALKWEDINMNQRFFWVKATAYYNDELGMVVENSPKSKASIRKIPLTDEAFTILQEKLVKRLPKDEYVFYNTYGSRIRECDVNKALKRIIVKKMHITDRFTPHNLRHTFATRCIEADINPKVLQKILGHEHISTTMDLYVHTTDEELSSEMGKLDMLL